MNTDTSPKNGKTLVSPVHLFLRFALNLGSRMLCSVFLLFYIFFVLLISFFSRRALWLVILISWIHIQKTGCFSSDCSSNITTVITIICLVLSRELSHKNSLDLDPDEMNSCLDFSCLLAVWPLAHGLASLSTGHQDKGHLYNGHHDRAVLPSTKACARSK
jgi:hypothetical protein